MEGDEIEMSEEELQEWIKEEVRKSQLVSPDMLEKCNTLQSYMERREKRATHLLKLCDSVAACEAIVQKQYSLLGWDYADTHSEDKVANCGPSPQFACGSVQSDTQDKHSSATNKLQHSEHLNSNYNKICSLVLKRKPVVVLTRLPKFQISALHPSTSEEHRCQNESFRSLDSEEVWKPEEDSSDVDHSLSRSETGSNNKTNLHDEKSKTSKGGATPKANSNTETKINAMKTRTSQDNSTSDAMEASPPTAKISSNVNNNGSKTLRHGAKRSYNATPKSSSGEEDSSDPDFSISSVMTVSKKKRKVNDRNNKTSKGGATSKANSNTETESNATKTRTSQDSSTSDAKDSASSPPMAKTTSNVNNNGSKTLMHGAKRNDNATTKNTNATGASAVCTSTPRLAGGTATKPPPSTPQTEIVVDMFVLARRREMTWQKGQIKEIQTKEDGRVKYKVFFENKGKSLVSGHHIALDCLPKVDNLVVGARVVIERPDDKECCPGILTEVPSRKNRMRFLVFTDDQKPFYVALRALHLVYKPLPDPLDDIINEDHRAFVKEYLERWPYPPLTHYRVGQMVNAELNGTLQKCEVLVVDSSLIQVIFQETQDKEWIYRGSLRLEHMINMKKALAKNVTSAKN